eukprot:3806739-Rhodomonas_salina.1
MDGWRRIREGGMGGNRRQLEVCVCAPEPRRMRAPSLIGIAQKVSQIRADRVEAEAVVDVARAAGGEGLHRGAPDALVGQLARARVQLSKRSAGTITPHPRQVSGRATREK